MHKDIHDYVVGIYQEPPQGRVVPQERKSPPLTAFLPNRDDYVAPSVESYYRPEFVDLEWERLWTRTWLCAGRVSDVATPGQWFRFDFGRESFIIVRNDENEINALYNVCTHRANRLVDDEFGSSSRFICPYHSWNFDRSGRCRHVTDRELFHPRAMDGGVDLGRVRCETFGGFVFVSMDEKAPPLADFLGEVTQIVAGYQLERMEVRGDVMLELACNWKTIQDAFSENYHVHMTHQFAMPVTEDKIGQMDFYPGGHTRRIVAIGDPARRRGEETSLHPMQVDLLVAAGIDPASYTGGPYGVRRAVQEAKRRMGGDHAQAYAGLSDNQLTDDWAMNIFPRMHWSMHAEGILVLSYYPHRSDPGRCWLQIMTLGHPGVPFSFYIPDATGGRPARRHVRHDDPDVKDVIGQLLWEDIRNTREAQLGMQSRGFSRMRLCEHEQPIMYQYAMREQYLRGDR